MSLQSELKKLENPQKAKNFQRFFKTGPGEYAEGDIFLGIPVPETRKIVKQFTNLQLTELALSLKSKYHEERLAALLILIHQFKTSRLAEQKKIKKANLDGIQESKLRIKILDEAKKDRKKQMQIFQFYLSHTKYINNWDLVDLSAPLIVGEFLFNDEKSILIQLAKSPLIWERRIAMLACLAFIKKKKFGDSLSIAEILMNDEHDLMHKAVGWMLREIGKRNISILETFLQEHYKQMPRTMLRYAIEKFPEEKRQAYLKGEI